MPQVRGSTPLAPTICQDGLVGLNDCLKSSMWGFDSLSWHCAVIVYRQEVREKGLGK